VLQHPAIFDLQFKAAHTRITAFTNQPMRWYRPGRAFYNQTMLDTLRIMPGYEPQVALASMVPLDVSPPTHDPQFTAWYAAQFIFPGAILILHGGAIAHAEKTATALTLLLQELKSRDYRVVTLSELWDHS
jgi:peptidoglycan-N-acetylglucosamine deacetylase